MVTRHAGGKDGYSGHGAASRGLGLRHAAVRCLVRPIPGRLLALLPRRRGANAFLGVPGPVEDGLALHHHRDVHRRCHRLAHRSPEMADQVLGCRPGEPHDPGQPRRSRGHLVRQRRGSGRGSPATRPAAPSTPCQTAGRPPRARTTTPSSCACSTGAFTALPPTPASDARPRSRYRRSGARRHPSRGSSAAPLASPPAALGGTRASGASPGAGLTAAAGHSLPASHSKTRIVKTFFCV